MRARLSTMAIDKEEVQEELLITMDWKTFSIQGSIDRREHVPLFNKINIVMSDMMVWEVLEKERLVQ